MGYNGFPRDIEDTEFRLNNRDEKYSLTCHAEVNVIYNATYHGISLRDSTVYVSSLPCCSACALALIQVGVNRVVMEAGAMERSEKWRTSFEKTSELFNEAGIEFSFIDS